MIPQQPEKWIDSMQGQKELFYNVCTVYVNAKLQEKNEYRGYMNKYRWSYAVPRVLKRNWLLIVSYYEQLLKFWSIKEKWSGSLVDMILDYESLYSIVCRSEKTRCTFIY